jgi:hypothetical protein
LLKDPGHGANFLTNFSTLTDKHRIDEIGGAQVRFAHEATYGFGAAQAARTMRGKTHC